MKLDYLRDNHDTIRVFRVHPLTALAHIREAVRPGILRSQRRWRRKARLRKLARQAEQALIVTLGVLGTVCAAYFVASEAYYLVAYLTERMR